MAGNGKRSQIQPPQELKQKGERVARGRNRFHEVFGKKWWILLLDRFVETCLLSLLVLLPLVMTPNYSSLNVKEAVGQFILLLALFAFICRTLILGRIEIPKCPQWLPFFGIVAYAFVSLTFTPAKRTAIRDYTLVFSFSMALVLFSYYLRHRRFRRLSMILIVFSSTIVALLANFQMLQLRSITFDFLPEVTPGMTERTWASSTIGHNNGTSVFMMLSSFAALFLLIRARTWLGRTLMSLVLMLDYYVIISCQTRAVWLALPPSLLVFFISYYWRRVSKRNRGRLIVIGGATISVIFILALSFYAVTAKQNQDMNLPSLSERLAQFSPKSLIVDTRARIASIGTYMITEKPIFGHGFASFKYIYPLYQGEYFEKFPDSPLAPTGRHTDRAHNEYLQSWIEMGLAGILLPIWLLLVHVKFMYRTVRRRMSREKHLLVSAATAASVGLLLVNVLSFELHVATSVILTIFWTGALLQTGSKKATYRLTLGAFGSITWLKVSTAVACFVLLFQVEMYTAKNLWGNHLMILGRSFRDRAYSYLTTDKNKVAENLKTSILCFQKGTKLAPYDGLIAYELGETLGKLGEFYLNHMKDGATAESYYNQAMVALTKASREYQYKGLYYSLGKANAFLYYIRRHPQSAELAIKNYRTSFYIYPDELFARDQLARFYWYTGRREEAIAEWKAITDFYPEFTEDYLIRDARSSVTSNQMEMAEDFYEAALNLSPDNLELRNELARFYIKQKRPEEAYALFDQYVRAKEDFTDVLQSYYEVCLDAGDEKKLSEVVERAKEQNQYHAYRQLFNAYMDRKQYAEALETVDKLMEVVDGGKMLRRTYKDKFAALWSLGDLVGILSTWKDSEENLEVPNTEEAFYIAQYQLNLPVLTCLAGIGCF